MSILKLALIFLLILNSCDFSNSEYNSKIDDELTWSNNDEYPSTKNCDMLSIKSERENCLKKHLFQSIYKNFNLTNFSLQNNIIDTILVSMIIDKNGKIRLHEFEKINDNNFNMEFRNKISEIINNLNTIIPANKTNLGISVSSKFSIPIVINTKN